MLLKSFMITARVCLSHFEKTFITESEKKKHWIWAVFNNVFIDLSNIEVPVSKKWSDF